MTNSSLLRRLACASAAMVAATTFTAAIMTAAASAAGEVNIYSFRQPSLIKPLLDSFTKKTGIKVNILFAKKGLIERMQAEGRNSPADLLLTSDFGRLVEAVEKKITQPVNSAILRQQIPAAYRGAKGEWFGLTRRARVVYAARDRVKQDAITYEELADPKWKGRICIRSGQQVYNVALFASMIAHHGAAKAKAWLTGLKNNLARKPSGSDRGQVKAVYAGSCDIAIANTYYMGKMQTNAKKPEQQQWAASVKLLFPNAAGRGTHVNLSGMVLARHSPNKAAAILLMEHLASDQAQRIYAAVNFEYPVSVQVPQSQRVKSWGVLKADPIKMEAIVRLRKAASRMVDEVGFNSGPSS